VKYDPTPEEYQAASNLIHHVLKDRMESRGLLLTYRDHGGIFKTHTTAYFDDGTILFGLYDNDEDRHRHVYARRPNGEIYRIVNIQSEGVKKMFGSRVADDIHPDAEKYDIEAPETKVLHMALIELWANVPPRR
jgi:hypothetical protein